MKYFSLFVFAIILFSCSNPKPKEVVVDYSQDEQFNEFKERFVEELWSNYPIWASYEGLHDMDDQLPIQNQDYQNRLYDFWNEMDQQMSEFSTESLSPLNQIDYHLIQDQFQSVNFYLEHFAENSWNPSVYNLGGAFYQVINYRGFPLDVRLEKAFLKMGMITDYYIEAQQNIETPTAIHTELAIQQLKGSIGVFENTLLDSLKASTKDDAFKSKFKDRVQESIKAIDGFLQYLKTDVQNNFPDNARDFRIGSELYEEKFKQDIQSAYTAQEIYRFALEEKAILHDKMFATSEELWDKYYEGREKPANRLDQIRAVISAVSKKHVAREEFIKSIRKQIPELEKFVSDNALIGLDPDKPLVVRETPEYMRGFAGASISAPGPYDKNAETYYNVTPLDNYTEEEAESYLREYNYYTLQILNIHEAIPGHYTQLVYSNQSPSIIKSIFGNGAMVEGWAVYTELMMMENGYGKGEPEMDLMYYKWNLRTVCNTILDYGIHVENLQESEAMDLLVNQAFQESSEAKGKWKRARLSQVQLCSYFTGFYEIRALREEIKSIQGSNFDLKAFHEAFLSYGSSPVKYIRDLMLKTIEEKGSLV